MTTEWVVKKLKLKIYSGENHERNEIHERNNRSGSKRFILKTRAAVLKTLFFVYLVYFVVLFFRFE